MGGGWEGDVFCPCNIYLDTAKYANYVIFTIGFFPKLIVIKECGENTYGAECKQSCGNCSNREPCHHVNGSCPSGCDAGAYGDKCDIGSTICYRIYLTFFNVFSNGRILLPLNNHIGIKNFCGIVFHSPTIE